MKEKHDDGGKNTNHNKLHKAQTREVISTHNNKKNKAHPFATLPDELILFVFSLLDSYSILVISSVDKRFNFIANDEGLWKHVYQGYTLGSERGECFWIGRLLRFDYPRPPSHFKHILFLNKKYQENNAKKGNLHREVWKGAVRIITERTIVSIDGGKHVDVLLAGAVEGRLYLYDTQLMVPTRPLMYTKTAEG